VHQQYLNLSRTWILYPKMQNSISSKERTAGKADRLDRPAGWDCEVKDGHCESPWIVCEEISKNCRCDYRATCLTNADRSRTHRQEQPEILQQSRNMYRLVRKDEERSDESCGAILFDDKILRSAVAGRILYSSVWFLRLSLNAAVITRRLKTPE